MEFTGNLTEKSAGKPDVVTYTSIIQGLAQSENMFAGKKIMILYREMRDIGIKPDDRMVSVMVDAFGTARLVQANIRTYIPSQKNPHMGTDDFHREYAGPVAAVWSTKT